MSSQIKYRIDYTPPDFTITHMELQVDLDESCTQIIATSQVIRLSPNARSLFLNGDGLTLCSVKIAGVEWHNYELLKEGLLLKDVPEKFTLTIVNTITPITNTALSGLYVSGSAMCTQCEAEGFRRITYFLDRPDVLTRFTTRLIGDKQRYPALLCNGNRIAHGELAEGKHWALWEDPHPKPSYLFALVAGDFDCLSDHFMTCSGRLVQLQLFVDKGNLTRATWAMQSLKAAMRWDEQRFNLEYDLDIYMIVAVDFFNMGAMENKGLNIFNSKFVLADAATATDKDYAAIESVIGHEYFHNWTGNRVTCRDWFQLSLKEGLTVFRDQEFSSDLGSRAVNRIEQVRLLRTVQFAEDASPMAHPIRPDKVVEMDNFYTVTVYEKGAEVIRMMHTLLGEFNFQQGMKCYFERFDGQAVTCDDFIQAMQDASGVDLTQFKQWYSQSGTPIVTVTDRYDSHTQQYYITLQQYTPITAEQTQPAALLIPISIELYNRQGQKVVPCFQQQTLSPILQLSQYEQTFIFDGLTEKPILGLLAGFSAPVKLNYAYSDDDLLFLLQYATDTFIRWDAMQTLCHRAIQQIIVQVQLQQSLVMHQPLLKAFKYLLNQSIEPYLLAQLLDFPSEVEIAELFQEVDIDAIATTRKFIIEQIVLQYGVQFEQCYRSAYTDTNHFSHNGMAKCTLQGVILLYLAMQPQDSAALLVKQHYQQAKNMTDCLHALNAANSGNLSCRTLLMQHFEERWRHDGLVMDKWFTLQATQTTPDVLTHIKELMTHPSFSLSNPNRVRALVGSFCRNNPVAFHRLDGSGYQFLAEILIYLNEHNPKIASRLVDPLLRFKRYDITRQNLIKNTLQRLYLLPNLAVDLQEKLNKSLES